MAKPLTQDDKDQLADLLQHPGLAVLYRVLDMVAEAREADVLKLDLSNSNDRELVLRKSRAEGARQVAVDLKRQLSSLRSKTEPTE